VTFNFALHITAQSTYKAGGKDDCGSDSRCQKSENITKSDWTAKVELLTVPLDERLCLFHLAEK
jgi:hypothetical protein